MAVEAWEVIGRYASLMKASKVLEKLRENDSGNTYRLIPVIEYPKAPWEIQRKIK